MFPASVKGSIEAARWLDEVSAAAQFPEDLAFRLQLCVEELFTNVVRHGGGVWTAEPVDVATPVTVSIVIARGDDGLSVVLEDNGRPFDAASAPAKRAGGGLEGVQPGGLGIALVKEFSAGLSYEYGQGMNRTALKFLWPKSAQSLK